MTTSDSALDPTTHAARDARTGALLVAAAASTWGCWSLVFKPAERMNGAPLSAAVETLVVFAAMFVAMAPLGLRAARMTSTTTQQARRAGAWRELVALGVSDACNALCFFGAMQRTSVAVAVLTHYLAPLFVALAAPVVLGERWRARTFVALGIALCGLVLLLRPWQGLSAHDVEGALLGTASAVFYAANVFFGKRLVGSYHAYEVAAWPKAAALVVLGAFVLVQGVGTVSSSSLLLLAMGGVVCGAMPTLLFFAGLQRVVASRASVLTLMEPLVAVLVGVIVWGEALSAIAACGGALVLVGAAVLVSARD